MRTKRWIIEGKVQGVSFRAYTQRKAMQLGLTGWVRNIANGCVETLAKGEESRLLEFYEWLDRGSPDAHVTSVTEMTVAEFAISPPALTEFIILGSEHV